MIPQLTESELAQRTHYVCSGVPGLRRDAVQRMLTAAPLHVVADPSNAHYRREILGEKS